MRVQSSSSVLRRTALLAALLSVNACYTYAPMEGPAPVGSEVRARLTPETALKESELTGILVQDYQGRVMGLSSDSIMISIVAARAVGVSQTQTVRRTVGLPLTGVQALSERRLSGVRTFLAAAAGAGLVAVVASGLGTGGGGPGEGEGPPPDGTFVPLFRIFWPF